MVQTPVGYYETLFRTVKKGCSLGLGAAAKAPRQRVGSEGKGPRLKVLEEMLKAVPPKYMDAFTVALHGTICMRIS
jgi:hypothetical protein